MDPKDKKGRIGAAAAFAVTLPFSVGCADHRLPPTPPPDPGANTPLPGWFDESARWNPHGNDDQVYIAGKIVFDNDRDTIKRESEPTLMRLLQFLIDHPEVSRLRVEGYTDDRAGVEYNQDLSARRALAVCDWLVDHNIDNLRLVAIGFGKLESKFIAPNDIAAGRAENRRTEFHVHEINGAAFAPGDPLKGGQVLTVLSQEERYRLKHPPKPDIPPIKPFHPTGNETHEVAKPRPPDPNAPPVLTPEAPKGS